MIGKHFYVINKEQVNYIRYGVKVIFKRYNSQYLILIINIYEIYFRTVSGT